MQRLRDRLQERARRALGREPPPRGHAQRRRARRALDLGGLHALHRRALHGGLPGRLLLQAPTKAWCCTTRTSASAAATAPTPAVRRAAVPEQRHLRPARQDGQVHLLRRRPGENGSQAEFEKYGATGWPKASCRPAPRCARPRRCSAATATWWPTSSATACWCAARAARCGAGARPTASRRRRRRRQDQGGHQVMIGRIVLIAALPRAWRPVARRRRPPPVKKTDARRRGTARARVHRAPAGRPATSSWEAQMRTRAQQNGTSTTAPAAEVNGSRREDAMKSHDPQLLLALGWASRPCWCARRAAPADAASAAAASLPRPDETNAQRAKSQPGNNARCGAPCAIRATGRLRLAARHRQGRADPALRAVPGSASPTPARPGARCATAGSCPTAAQRCC